MKESLEIQFILKEDIHMVNIVQALEEKFEVERIIDSKNNKEIISLKKKR